MSAEPPVIVATWKKNTRENARLALQEYRGKRLVDLRLTVPIAAHSDQQMVTRQGVSLDVSLLPELREAVVRAETLAREMGWLE